MNSILIKVTYARGLKITCTKKLIKKSIVSFFNCHLYTPNSTTVNSSTSVCLNSAYTDIWFINCSSCWLTYCYGRHFFLAFSCCFFMFYSLILLEHLSISFLRRLCNLCIYEYIFIPFSQSIGSLARNRFWVANFSLAIWKHCSAIILCCY